MADTVEEKGTKVPESRNGSDGEDGVVTDIDEGALLRKLDIRLLPAVGILYLLSFLDRSNGSSSTPRPAVSCISFTILTSGQR